MQTFVTFIILSFVLLYSPVSTPSSAMVRQNGSNAKQLYAARGEVIKMKSPSKGMLLITIKPGKEFAEVTVLARANDLVGSAPRRSGGVDLFGVFGGDSRDDETITAAELQEGDLVSVIYDPQLQNRVIELYIH